LILYNPQVMDEKNPNPQPYEPWLLPDVIIIPRILHDLPNHPKNLLPKFDPEKKYSAEDHVHKFLSTIRIQNVLHKDVVCRLFPHTFENKSTTWLYSMDESSITSWRIFVTIFLKKFREDKTSATSVLDISRIKMDTNEKVKYFNQCFLYLLKQTSKPIVEVTIEFYTLSLPMSMAMFIKNVEKATLEATFQEALIIEKNMLSLKGNLEDESSKNKSKTKAKSHVTKSSKEKKYTDSMDMESLQRIVNKLSNKLIDLKKHNGEGSSNTKNFFKFQSKKDKSTPPVKKMTPSTSEGINMV
jgi:hypothetical protein